MTVSILRSCFKSCVGRKVFQIPIKTESRHTHIGPVLELTYIFCCVMEFVTAVREGYDSFNLLVNDCSGLERVSRTVANARHEPQISD
jgi:hypothetical protein